MIASVQSQLKSPITFLVAIIRAWYKTDKLKLGERKTPLFEAILILADCLYIGLSKNTTPTIIGHIMAEHWPTKCTHVLSRSPQF
jgi:hypothetical protein